MGVKYKHTDIVPERGYYISLHKGCVKTKPISPPVKPFKQIFKGNLRLYTDDNKRHIPECFKNQIRRTIRDRVIITVCTEWRHLTLTTISSSPTTAGACTIQAEAELAVGIKDNCSASTWWSFDNITHDVLYLVVFRKIDSKCFYAPCLDAGLYVPLHVYQSSKKLWDQLRVFL